PFLDTLSRPRDGPRRPLDNAVVLCRCEEVRRGAVAQAVGAGCPGPNQLKSFTRAGMGPCPACRCGHTVTETRAGLRGSDPGAVAQGGGEGCPGPNQLKSVTRAGMGPCQGRMCGHTVTETLAGLRGIDPGAVGYFRIRMPIKPVTVGEIAGVANQKEV